VGTDAAGAGVCAAGRVAGGRLTAAPAPAGVGGSGRAAAGRTPPVRGGAPGRLAAAAFPSNAGLPVDGSGGPLAPGGLTGAGGALMLPLSAAPSVMTRLSRSCNYPMRACSIQKTKYCSLWGLKGGDGARARVMVGSESGAS